MKAFSDKVKGSIDISDVHPGETIPKFDADGNKEKTLEELQEICRPEKYVGRAPQQTTDFLNETVAAALAPYEMLETEKAEINV